MKYKNYYTRLGIRYHNKQIAKKYSEKGIALAIALILLGLLLSFTALSATLVTSEARIADAQYKNTRTFNAAMASLEIMTEKFSSLYAVNQNPTAGDIANLTSFTPSIKDGSTNLYDFSKQSVLELSGGRQLVTVQDAPYNGLTARERVFRLQTIVSDNRANGQVRLTRDVANYQIPIFQFTAFGFDNLDISPGPVLYLGGRTHCNRSIFFTRTNGGGSDGPAQFYGPITAAGEMSHNLYPSGGGGDAARYQQIYNGTTLVNITPSIQSGQGPDNPATATSYDYGLTDDPTVPGNGTQIAGYGPAGLVTPRAPKLNLPTETQGFQAVEILRRALPGDNAVLESSRLFNGKFARYSTIRILLDDDLNEFPTSAGGVEGPQAYDLSQLADPNDANFTSFWTALTGNVRTFNALQGSDNPDAAVGILGAGSGAALNPAIPVLPPQTNIINAQPEYQKNADGSVNGNLRKHSYIKIELINNNNPPNPPTRTDITKHILNLGITAGPIPLPNYNAGNPFSPFDNLADIATGTGGAVDPQTTYAYTYPLNDGNSIPRLTNTTSDVPENFLPFLNNSTTSVNIGKHANAFGAAPIQGITFRSTGSTKNANIAYVYEPNSILHLQRTYFPYSPTNTVDMTCADPPSTSDKGVAVLNPSNGRVNAAGGSSNAATDYPAKLKSLIAKPYFRFTDDFINNTYAKGDYTVVGGVGYFKMRNPLAAVTASPAGASPYKYVFNATSATADKTPERFMRGITVQAPTFSTAGVKTGSFTSGSLSNANALSLTIAAGSPATYDIQKILQSSITAGGNSVSGVWDTTTATNHQTLAGYLRQYIFKPGIPGFYSLGWGSGAALDPTVNTIIGDKRIDLDVNLTGASGINPAVATFAPASTYTPGDEGVVDLQELTPFSIPNAATGAAAVQAKLQQYLFSPSTLTAADFPYLLPTPTSIATLLTNLKPAEIGTAGRYTDPTLSGFPAGVNGVPEIPKENLVFDWNGDGIIESPKLPFQNTGTLGANAIGYSVESNVNSLIPSSLQILHDSPSTASAPAALVNTTTSVPIEIRFIEDDASTLPLNSTPNLGATGAGGECNLTGQTPPTLVATPPFVNGINSFVINVPFNSIPGQMTVTTGLHSGKKINLREAVSIIFQHPLATRSGGTSNVLEAQLGRRLGLTDAHFAYPGHAYMAFTPHPIDPRGIPSNNSLISRLRIVMDKAFPINTYDQREGRHISRRYGFQNIPTAADYYNADIGAGSQRAVNAEWPDWPTTATVADNDNILRSMATSLPMPSPIALERRGVMNVVEIDMGNLKKLFRGDFNTYLTTFAAGFTSGQPAPNPNGDPLTVWGGTGVIDISDNGFVVYISDRRGDDNNDGIYEFNDVFGENNSLDLLDDTVGQITTGPQNGKPGDTILRRDVDVETQPTSTPAIANPARAGESPHGSMPVNDGYEYFCGNINVTTRRNDPISGSLTYSSLLPGTTSATTGTFATLAGNGSSNATGAQNWRMVDSAKTGRIRAFRHAVRLVNAMDVPRWYLPTDGAVPRHFTGMTLVSENPAYVHGNLNSIGVQVSPSDVLDPDSNIPAGGPTQTRKFLQTGNVNNGRTPGDWEANAASFPDDRLFHGPIAIMADAVSIHSRNWQDSRMFVSPHSSLLRTQTRMQRLPIETTVKAAWFTGQPKAGTQTTSQNTITSASADWGGAVQAGISPNSQGGLHNFPRFGERWAGARFNYNGSFIWDFYSHQGNGPWLFSGPDNGGNYDAPTRNWNFDAAFRKLGGLPPATPRVVFYKIRGFRQVFLEDNPH